MKLSDEEHIAYRLRQTLNMGTDQLDSSIIQRLFEARTAALNSNSDSRRRPTRIPAARVVAAIAPWMKVALMAIALSIGIAGTYYWNLFDEASEYEEIDSALLADDVPPNVYIDQGFHKWLERSSPSSAPQ